MAVHMSPGLEGPYASLHPPPLILLTPVVLAAAGCADTEPPVAPGSDPAAASAAGVETDLRADRGTIDDRWAAISQTEVPGFAGLWYDSGTGEIVVAATEAGSESAARGFVERSSAPSDFPGSPVRFDIVTYDFLQLRRWKAAARELLGESGVVSLDADEVRNRLVLGVTPDAVTSEVRARARELGIPDAGVELERTSRSTFERGGADGESSVAAGSPTLRDTVRPTMGGLEVGYEKFGVGGSGDQRCTLGFNTELDGESGIYFATASHCSSNNFSPPDDDFFTQDSAGPRVGRESHDIQPQTGTFVFNGQSYDCTSPNLPCRFSDASLVAYDDTIDASDVDLGRIARTNVASLTIDGRYDIVVKRDPSDLTVGLKVRIVGRTTGTTGGEIIKTCVDQHIDAEPGFDEFNLLCQYRTDYVSDDGDSGAPVYIRHWDGTVALVGIHFWGQTGFLSYSLFSSLAGIEADLGVTLDVCIPTGCATPPPPLDVEIDGPTEVLEWAQCTYTADATGAYPPYSYQWYIDGEAVEEEGGEEELVIEDVGEDDFLLEVRVTDSKSFNEWADVSVDVSGSHPNCPLGP